VTKGAHLMGEINRSESTDEIFCAALINRGRSESTDEIFCAVTYNASEAADSLNMIFLEYHWRSNYIYIYILLYKSSKNWRVHFLSW
jgi:hypothetical protein